MNTNIGCKRTVNQRNFMGSCLSTHYSARIRWNNRHNQLALIANQYHPALLEMVPRVSGLSSGPTVHVLIATFKLS